MEKSQENLHNSLRWDHTPKEIMSLSEDLINDQTAVIESVINLEDPRTFKNTIEPIVKHDYTYCGVYNNMDYFKKMSTCEELRNASSKATEKLNDFEKDLWMRYDFYQTIQQYKQASVESKEWDNLDEESQRYVDRLLRDFERKGMHLSEDKRNQI